MDFESEWIDEDILLVEPGEDATLHVHMEDTAVVEGLEAVVVVTTDLSREQVRRLRELCDLWLDPGCPRCGGRHGRGLAHGPGFCTDRRSEGRDQDG